jgi:hypothetical protein
MDGDQNVELGIMALQIFLALARAAGLSAEERLALYQKTDDAYTEMTSEPLPSVDD